MQARQLPVTFVRCVPVVPAMMREGLREHKPMLPPAVVEVTYQMTIQHIATLVLEAALALFTAFAAFAQARRVPAIVKSRQRLHYPQWYWNLSNGLAVIGALGLFVGLFVPLVGVVAALWMVAYFVVAALTHLSKMDMKGVVPAILFLAICAGLVALRWADARPILALVGLK